jgi:aromatic ring-opening dioxygenase LigB subunit
MKFDKLYESLMKEKEDFRKLEKDLKKNFTKDKKYVIYSPSKGQININHLQHDIEIFGMSDHILVHFLDNEKVVKKEKIKNSKELMDKISKFTN